MVSLLSDEKRSITSEKSMVLANSFIRNQQKCYFGLLSFSARFLVKGVGQSTKRPFIRRHSYWNCTKKSYCSTQTYKNRLKIFLVDRGKTYVSCPEPPPPFPGPGARAPTTKLDHTLHTIT